MALRLTRVHAQWLYTRTAGRRPSHHCYSTNVLLKKVKIRICRMAILKVTCNVTELGCRADWELLGLVCGVTKVCMFYWEIFSRKSANRVPSRRCVLAFDPVPLGLGVRRFALRVSFCPLLLEFVVGEHWSLLRTVQRPPSLSRPMLCFQHLALFVSVCRRLTAVTYNGGTLNSLFNTTENSSQRPVQASALVGSALKSPQKVHRTLSLYPFAFQSLMVSG